MPGLRERKAAKTRHALLEALVERLHDRPLEAIPAKELCKAVGISEPTFFNYFPRKEDLLTFFIQLWSLEGAAAAWATVDTEGPLEAIRGLFRSTGEAMAQHPNLTLELIRHQSRLTPDTVIRPLTEADRQLRFGDEPDTHRLTEAGLGALLPELVQRAVDRGELPDTVDRRQLTLALASVFFGVPLLLGPTEPGQVAEAYDAQLDLILAGALAQA